MVEYEDFGIDAGFFECRAKSCFDEVTLFLPGHIHGHGVAVVQRLVLNGHGIDVKAFGFHSLNPLHEVLGVSLVVLRGEAAGSPAQIWALVGSGTTFHPTGC